MHPSLLRLDKPPLSENGLLGTFAKPEDVEQYVETTTRVLRPNGSTLCVLLKNAISEINGAAMYYAVRSRIATTRQRKDSAGGAIPNRVKKTDGTVSRTREGPTVYSGIAGYFGRTPRLPYCRATAFVHNHPQAFSDCLPAIREADALFSRHMPEAYARQLAQANKTHSDFLINGTAFTTLTLNKNFRTAYHKDAGDLPDGFGVMSYYRAGQFDGGELVFPTWRVALKLDTFDVVLFDPHELHGNLAIQPLTRKYERITCVHYLRADMVYCGSAAEELRIAASHDTTQGPRKMKRPARLHVEA